MIKVISNRHELPHISWQIVHEWEDDFMNILKSGIVLESENKKNIFQKIRYHSKLVRYIPPFSIRGEYKVIFQMSPPYEFNYFSKPNYIPIIIDAWRNDIARIQEFCLYNKDIFLGSLEAVKELQNRNFKKVFYLPVSISKRYKRECVPEKDIDLLVYGRSHECLKRWVEKIKTNLSLNIVQCFQDKNGDFVAWSNCNGFIGTINERSELMDLIARSRYTLVSSPGNDPENRDDIVRTGGYSPVTPRFFEAAVNYSMGIGIYPHNPDYVACNIDQIAILATDYEMFEAQIFQKPDLIKMKEKFDQYLENHWTEKRVETVLNQIAK